MRQRNTQDFNMDMSHNKNKTKKGKIGYKATKNMRCIGLTYEVGKEYFISSKDICSHGFHYCKKIDSTLAYYNYNKDETVFIEVEDLDPDSIYDGDKVVSNHIKVLRIVPKEELQICKFDEDGNLLEDLFYRYEYDSRGNMITKQHKKNELITRFKYDENDNQIEYISPHLKWWKTYDEDGNELTYRDDIGNTYTTTYKDGVVEEQIKDNGMSKEFFKKKYDDNGNIISYANSYGFSWEATYDKEGRELTKKMSDGVSWGKTYDDKGNMVRYIEYYGGDVSKDWEIYIK